MPDLLPGAFFVGIVAAFTAVVVRLRSSKPRLSVLTVVLIGIAGAYLIPLMVAFFVEAWRSTTWLPELPVVTSGQMFMGVWAGFATILIGGSKAQPARVPLWAGVLAGVATASILPPMLDWATGTFQRASLRADVNLCTRGMLGQVQPREATNICNDPITVGLCVPGEVNPEACAQSYTIEPGQTAHFDPGGAALSSLPGNPGGLTVVACHPPDRPSRMVSVIGRGYEGVCLPPA